MKRYMINDGQIRVSVTEWGDENKPVIFCLHGLGSTSLSFIEIAENLKTNYRIISIDAPGHGNSSEFSSAVCYELPALANWLDRFIRLLSVEKFYFLSHSWGSFVALFYHSMYPDKVVDSILIDGGYQTKRLRGKTMQEEITFYEADFEQSWVTWEDFLDDAVYGKLRRSKLLDLAARDLTIVKEGRYYWHARGRTASHIIRGMHKDETADIYEKLPAESNIVLLRATLPKTEDGYRNMTANLFAQKSSATVKLVPDTSHMLHWENPQIVIEEIRKRWK